MEHIFDFLLNIFPYELFEISILLLFDVIDENLTQHQHSLILENVYNFTSYNDCYESIYKIITTGNFIEACEIGNIKIVGYLIGRKLIKTGYSCCVAAENGHLEVLKYLLKHDFPKSGYACYAAVENGHLEIVKCLVEQGFYKSDNACYIAAENGHLEVLKYLVEQRFPDYEKYLHKIN